MMKNKVLNFLQSSGFLLPLFLLIGAGLSVFLKYEIMWDFANYHYYNPWAFLTGRIGYDIAPAGLNSYFNPLMDIPLYLLIKYFNDMPNLIYAFQGLYFGGLMFVFFKLLALCFDTSSRQGKLSLAAAFAIGLTGWAVWVQIGTSSNEIPITLLVLSGFYLLMRELFFCQSGSCRIYFISGFLLGTAMGLKLTAFIYCLSIGFSLLVFYRSVVAPKRNIASFIAGGLLGFLVFDGFWMYLMWSHFDNPAFPFLNNIFHSDYMPAINFHDTKHLPQNLWQWLFFPLYRAIYKVGAEENALILDYRLPLTYIVLLIGLTVLLFKRFKSSISSRTGFIITNFILGYVLWLSVFATSRYTVFLDLLLAMILVKAYVFAFPKRERLQPLYLSLGIIIAYSLLSTPYFSDYFEKRTQVDYQSRTKVYWLAKKMAVPQQNMDNAFIKIEKIKLPPDTLILQFAQPNAFLLPLLATDSIRALNMYNRMFVADDASNAYEMINMFNLGKWLELKEKIFAEHKGPIVALFVEDGSFFHPIWLQINPRLKNMKCRPLINNIMTNTICYPPELETQIFPTQEVKDGQ